MAQAMSPRNAAPKLRSTVVEKWGTPRRETSLYTTVALSRGYTVKAGRETRSRLHRGVERI